MFYYTFHFGKNGNTGCRFALISQITDIVFFRGSVTQRSQNGIILLYGEIYHSRLVQFLREKSILNHTLETTMVLFSEHFCYKNAKKIESSNKHPSKRGSFCSCFDNGCCVAFAKYLIV